MKRRIWIALALTGVVAIALLFGVQFSRTDRVTYENFQQIAIGMQEAYGHRSLSEPDEVTYCAGLPNERFLFIPWWRRKTWHGSTMSVSISIDQHGTVTDACTEHRVTFFVKVRQWLGLEQPRFTPYRIHGGVGPASSSI